MTELQSNVVEQELPTEQNPTVTEQTDVQTPNEELVVSAEENPSPKKKKKGKAFKIIALILIPLLLITNIATSVLLISSYIEEKSYDNLFDENKLVSAKSGEKWGFINKSGSYVINPQFDNVGDFVDGIARVEIDEKYGYINTKGKYVINPQFDYAGDFSDGIAVVETGDKYGYINTKGEYIINPQFDYADNFTDGIAVVKLNDKYGYIDTKGEYIINPQFDDAYNFSNGFATVKSGKYWGYINLKGDVIINYQYIRAYPMTNDGYALVVATDKKYLIIDDKGYLVSSSRFDGLDGYDYTFCQKDGCYNITYGDDYCSEHDYSTSTKNYCDAYGCTNTAYFGNYCYEHSYLE